MIQKIAAAFLTLILTASSTSAGGPENAVVVINSESASSKLVANHYISLRNIPARNVIYLSDITEQESIPIGEFRQQILKPIFETIAKRGLSNHIDYVIYSSGFPTVVDAAADRQKMLDAPNGGAAISANNRAFAPQVALTAATYLFQKVIAEDFSYALPNANTYMRNDTRTLLTNPFVGEDAATFRKALAGTRSEGFDESIELLESLAEKHPLQMALHYWLARTWAWKGEVEQATTWLKRAIATGWCYREFTESDTAFAELINDAAFQSTLELIPDIPFRFTPTLGFRSAFFWGPNGMVNSTPDQGNQYVLSTMLGVNRNQGNSEQETLQYLTRSIAADGTRPGGTIYFTKTKDVRSTTRIPGFDDATNELRLAGVRSEIITTVLPTFRNDVAGLSIGVGGFDWANSNSRILPGAICENLTSYGGALKPGVAQTKLTEFLRFGAAGSSGTVTEPLALQWKFPHPRIHVHYARGCTLAESFYQSVAGPFQLLIVGDALCKPWAQVPVVAITAGLEPDMEVKGALRVQMESANSPVPIRAIDLFLDDQLVRRIGDLGDASFDIDTRTMPDGYHEFRFVPIASGAIATRGLTLIPFTVNNKQHQVDLRTESPVPGIDDTLSFKVTSSGANSLKLVHNDRTLASQDGSEAEFNIAAYEFGRGPISIQAEADFDGQPVRSTPLRLEINGPISITLPIIQAPPVSKAQPKQ